ncbi:ATP-binding cassette sub-family C member 10 [Venturia canescens]|uniref:ATP-binding cassette sub-family C member 10 n=1 Tax=Venturia canescens TaxID=32260 RepID=UPI001C9C6CAB|nr:ATP-binding cassette sub-family C member 10 [Venturia canescens]
MEDPESESFFGRWTWNWTELCGYRGSIEPLNPVTHDLELCFQQFYLQLPTLALMAIISAYFCGKHNYSHERVSHIAINLRLIITAVLAILPIIKAYIIVTNTTITPLNDAFSNVMSSTPTTLSSLANSQILYGMNTGGHGLLTKIRDGLNNTSSIAKLIFYNHANHSYSNTSLFTENGSNLPLSMKYANQATAAKPIDYLIAGTEGVAWVVHLCFILTLRRSNSLNMRGPVAVRALIFMLIGVSALLLRTHVKHNPFDDVLPNLSLGFSIAVVTLLSFYVLTLIPGYGSNRTNRYSEVNERTSLLSSPNSAYVHFMEVQDPSYLGTAMENSTILSKLLFHWVTPLMEKGVRGLLRHPDDLYDLPDHITTAMINYEIDKSIRRMPRAKRRTNFNGFISETPEIEVISSRNNVSLLRLLHRNFGWQFYAVGILKFVADCTGFVGPLLLNKLVGFIEDKNKPISYGYMYAALMFFSTLLGAFCITHFSFWMSIVGLKIRAAIISLVYRKTLHSSNVELNRQFTFGEIVNFMSTDSDRIVNSCPSFHTFWSIPLQLAVTLYLLYAQIGLSFLAGVAFAVVLIPINKFLANKIGQLSTKMMNYKDKRVGLMGETLRGLTTIKLNAWEEYFLRSIFKLREQELKYLKGRKYLDALCVYFWATTPVLISILTFGTYVLVGNQLDAKTVFTSMALLNMLIGPLNAFPWVLNGLTEAWVSVKRIQRLLDLPDLDISTYYANPPPGVDIMLKNASFFVSDNHDDQTVTKVPESPAPSTSSSKKVVTFEGERVFTLKNLNIDVHKGQLIGVMGKVGGGKSLLLDGILAEITRAEGVVAVHDLDQGFGYVKQNPWLQRGTIRDNILFGKAYDHNKYKNILTACALTDDLMTLPKKDLTGVGEAGNTLSGGQRTRISLARAVYADKAIYLLDDILATLDTKVAKHIFQHVVLGLLSNKTRIMCTHQTQYLIHADLVIEMSKGTVVKQGVPSDILPDLEDYLLSSGLTDSDFEAAPISGLPKSYDELVNVDKDALLDEEFVERGTVRFGVYSAYMSAIGRYLAMSIFLSMLMMQCSRNFTDLWLSFWVTHANETSANTTNSSHQLNVLQLEASLDDDNGVEYYLKIYALLGLLNSIFTLIRAFMFAYGGIQAAYSMHKQLLKIVMRARTTFFDLHPLGRILNRFSSDTYTIDDSLPFIANILLAQSFALIGSIVVTAYSLPWIFLLLAPLAPVYHWAQQHYRLTSRELKRLSSTALSPLYAHFNETLQGLSSIRAFRVVSRFRHENELFLEASQKTQFAAMAAGQWLSLRLQFIGVVLLAGVCVMAVVQHQIEVADSGLIGLAITYALSVTGLMSGVVNVFTETEREIIAVERVKQYLDNIPTESIDGDNPPYGWPSQGVVEFRDVILKYRDGLTPSLRRLSFLTRPAEKIGIVGRTGAGKSSILNCLFRLVEITAGEIFIDNVDVKRLRLNALRSRLSIIPQNPFLFSGTIRDNVDPLDQYPDIQIYTALEKCKLHSLVHRLGGLRANLEENGNNLSAGQKQLFCLVRAMLQNARILCIDEATANVDQETDKAIQTTIKSSFRSATVITIAHRIRTIMHCDRVMVMGDGEVLEFGEPNFLIQNTNSYFYRLASQEFSDKE